MSKFVTYVIRMPDEYEARKAIVSGIRALLEQHGGEITGSSIDNEMTLVELLSRRLPHHEVEEVRQQAAKLAAAD